MLFARSPIRPETGAICRHGCRAASQAAFAPVEVAGRDPLGERRGGVDELARPAGSGRPGTPTSGPMKARVSGAAFAASDSAVATTVSVPRGFDSSPQVIA